MLSHVQASYNNNLLSKALVSLSLFWRRKMRIFQNQTVDDEEEMPLPLIEKPFTTEDNIISWLRLVSPGFIVDPNKVSVLYEPQEFYNKLLSLSQSAQSQISLASLYLGSGTLEQDLVKTLSENLSRSKELLLTVLLDYNRGSRGPVSSRQILHPLVQKFPEQCHVALYHTPLLREPLRSWLPGRANELVGLQHMKLYAFDDTIIISGAVQGGNVTIRAGVPIIFLQGGGGANHLRRANLSHDYFTNRQDRYVVVGGCGALAAWAHALVAAVARFSLRAAPDGGDALARGWHLHPFARGADPRAFARAARRLVRSAAFDQHQLPSAHAASPSASGRPAEASASASASGSESEGASGSTWVFPLLQMAQLGLRHDSRVTARLLAAAPAGGRLALATGYFNPPAEYADALLRRCRADCALLAAHPSASGFAGASGPAGAIPAAYAALAADFARRLRHARPDGGGVDDERAVALREYARAGWTFHAKGLWLTLPGAPDAAPALTLVGSPNFGARSLGRDLELQFALVTRDARLRAALAAERDRLYARAQPAPKATLRSSAPLWVRLVVGLARDFF